MESQPQSPEFRINPENFHPCNAIMYQPKSHSSMPPEIHIFFMHLCSLLFFFNFFSFRTSESVSNRSYLHVDQVRQHVGPDLDPNCLQRLSADDTRR